MISVQDIPVGVRVRLGNGAIAEVVENPRDGLWLLVRDVEREGSAESDRAEYLLHFSEVQGLVED